MTSLYDPTDHRPMHDSKTAFVDRTTELVDRVVSPEDYMDKDAGYEATQDGAYNAIMDMARATDMLVGAVHRTMQRLLDVDDEPILTVRGRLMMVQDLNESWHGREFREYTPS